MRRIFLVVDDREAEAARSRQQLASIDPAAEILCASSGSGALALLESRRAVPSLIFADFFMPGMNGIELLAAIRQRPWLEGVRVAILSERPSDRDVLVSYRLGACAFLTKPVSLHEMRETVRDWARAAVEMALGPVPATSAEEPGVNAA